MSDSQHILFIGSGPVSLLKAYFIASKNPSWKISIIDAANQFGGAWYSDQSPKGNEVECGCHIWSYVPESYEYIQSELGIPLVAYKPKAVFVGKNSKYPYSLYNSVKTYSYLFKHLLTGRWKAVSKMKENPFMQFKLIGKNNLYPRTGSPELIKALLSRIEGVENINLHKGVMVNSVQQNEKDFTINGSADNCFDQVYLTSVSQLKEIKTPTTSLSIESEQIDYIHLLLSTSKPLRKPISYWRLLSDPIIHRITDVSYQTQNKENLVLVGIKPDGFKNKSEDELLKHTTEVLKSHRVLDASNEIELVKTHIYPTYYISPEQREEIEELSNKMHVLHSTDLMHGIYWLLKEEELI